MSRSWIVVTSIIVGACGGAAGTGDDVSPDPLVDGAVTANPFRLDLNVRTTGFVAVEPTITVVPLDGGGAEVTPGTDSGIGTPFAILMTPLHDFRVEIEAADHAPLVLHVTARYGGEQADAGTMQMTRGERLGPDRYPDITPLSTGVLIVGLTETWVLIEEVEGSVITREIGERIGFSPTVSADATLVLLPTPQGTTAYDLVAHQVVGVLAGTVPGSFAGGSRRAILHNDAGHDVVVDLTAGLTVVRELPGSGAAASLSGNGEVLARFEPSATFAGPTVAVYDLATGNRTVPDDTRLWSADSRVELSSDGSVTIVTYGTNVSIFETGTGAPIADLSGSGGHVVSATRPGALVLTGNVVLVNFETNQVTSLPGLPGELGWASTERLLISLGTSENLAGFEIRDAIDGSLIASTPPTGAARLWLRGAIYGFGDAAYAVTQVCASDASCDAAVIDGDDGTIEIFPNASRRIIVNGLDLQNDADGLRFTDVDGGGGIQRYLAVGQVQLPPMFDEASSDRRGTVAPCALYSRQEENVFDVPLGRGLYCVR